MLPTVGVSAVGHVIGGDGELLDLGGHLTDGGVDGLEGLAGEIDGRRACNPRISCSLTALAAPVMC
jgi:hypothetical protein